ncbi:hypothetical protein [Bacillus sp. T33-2]|uniref:hypothetical protein n=1 Tax=Bacillus sp. T33-2 TaxID=2054168 RepID=UPI0015E0EAC1|nr:hypothetical protein [Bacillus sp. T33-2]
MTKYEVERSFVHFHTKEKLSRVKVTFSSGGIIYQVMNQNQLNSYSSGVTS